MPTIDCPLGGDLRPVGEDLVDDAEQRERGDAGLQAVQAHENRPTTRARPAPATTARTTATGTGSAGLDDEGERIREQVALQDGVDGEQAERPGADRDERDVPERQDSRVPDEQLQTDDGDEADQGISCLLRRRAAEQECALHGDDH